MMVLWSNDCDWLQLKVVALQKCLHAGIKTVILNTRKRNRYWKMTHSREKKVSVMRQQKFCNVAEKNKVTVESAVEKDSRTEKPQIADAARTHKDAKLQESS